MGLGHSLGLPHDLRAASSADAHGNADPLGTFAVGPSAASLRQERPVEIAVSYQELHGRLTSTEHVLQEQSDIMSVIVTKFLDFETDNSSKAESVEQESMFMQRTIKGLNTALAEAQRREDLSNSSVATDKLRREEDAYRQQHINATLHESIANIRG